MGDEFAYPRWECSSHTGCWYGEYWYCQEEECRYRVGPVPMQVASPQADDAMGYNGDYMNTGSVADGQNQWVDATFQYGGTPAYGELQDGYQPGSQQGYGTQQYGHYQQNGVYQNADQQNGHHSNNQYDGQHSGHQNGHQQNSQEGDVGWNNSQNGCPQWDVRRSSPPSPVSATMGSAPSTAQANSPTSTGTFDNEAASTAGNADEDRIGSYVAEQPTVGMDERDDEDTANQAMERIESCFPEYRNRDTRRQYQPSYSSELSFSDGSESDVTQPNVE